MRVRPAKEVADAETIEWYRVQIRLNNSSVRKTCERCVGAGMRKEAMCPYDLTTSTIEKPTIKKATYLSQANVHVLVLSRVGL